MASKPQAAFKQKPYWKPSKTKSSSSLWDEGLTPDEKTLVEVFRHYQQWTRDNDQRRTRKNGWNDVTDAYWGKLPFDWPYTAKVVDPRIRTSIIEKDARLLNQKLRGRLVPREGGDVLSAKLNNALLDFQWDSANDGGTMLDKLSMCSQDTRLYGSKFVLNWWKHEPSYDGREVLFDGNEMKVLDIRDCGMDPTADHIRNAKWFQHRAWAKIVDLERIQDIGGTDQPMYPGLSKLKEKMTNGRSDRRDVAYANRILNLKGLEDHVGDDLSFPVVEVVTEYRCNRFVTFSPKYKVILRDIENPYDHHRIPISQLRYYSLQGDPLGESEVEPVLPIWKAIQATLCGYLDNMNIHMRPPLKVVTSAVRIETLVYGPEAQWDVDRIDAVQEFQGNGDAMRYFQTTYQALVSSFNTAMGDTSLGISAIDPTANKRTATEIKDSNKQQNTRDQKNQTSLSELIQDVMSMWLSNNRQFLFADIDKKEYILRIVGSEMFNYFQRAGLDELEVPTEAMQTIGEIVHQSGGNVSDEDLQAMIDAGKTPRYPIYENPKEKNPAKMVAKPKMRINDMGDGAEVSLTPDDLEGLYDYVPDVKSMSAGAEQDMIQGRQAAIETITTNPIVLQLLAQENVKPKLKELLVSQFESAGLKDAERFFETLPPSPNPMQGQPPQPGQPQLPPGQPQQLGPGAQQPPDMNAIIDAGNQPSPLEQQANGLPGQIPA